MIITKYMSYAKPFVNWFSNKFYLILYSCNVKIFKIFFMMHFKDYIFENGCELS